MIHKTHWEGKPTLETLTGNHRAKIIICIITQNPWEIGFELLQHTTKSFSKRCFFWFYQKHGTEKQFIVLMRNRTSDLQIPTLMLYHWVTETLLWAKLLQGPHVRCIQQSRIARVESISKGKSKSIVLTSYIWMILPVKKTKVSLWVWFFQSQYGKRYQYFWFWHILLSKKGDTVTNVYSHAYWTNWQWFSMVCILINNNYSLSKWSTFAADSCSLARWVSKKFEHCDDKHHCL